MSSHHPRLPQQGFTLIELMLAITLGLLVVAGSMAIFLNIKLSYTSQDQQAQTQDTERQAIAMLTTTVQSAGYFVNPVSFTRDTALPVTTVANPDGTVFAAAQSVAGSTDKAGQSTLNVRFQTDSGDGVMNCIGGTNTSGASAIYVNSFAISASNELTCSVNGATAQPLLDNVAGMTVLYGVDTDTAAQFDASPTVDTYLTAAQVTAASQWGRVLTVQVTLTFTNSSRPWVQLINLMNHV
jgi:type IV pilus assembly protein PilW